MMLNLIKKATTYSVSILKTSLIAVIVGTIGGIIGGVFHRAVDFATDLHTENEYLIFLLPIAGLLTVFLYRLANLRTDPGTNRIISGVRGEAKIPTALAPLIFIATTLTHLFGGSAGREGAALQLGGSIGSVIGKLFKLDQKTMPLIILCGMSGVFSALFGTPLTATLFAVEVCTVGALYYSALIPCFISAYSAVFLTMLLGNHPVRLHVLYVPITDISSVVAVIILGIACGLLGIIFCKSLKTTHSLAAKINNGYVRIFVGGVIITALTLICRTHDYNGAGMDVIQRALNSEASPYAFALKILFTAITIGVGFKGGEIIPTFFIGATFGCFAGPILGLPSSFAAAAGIVALFAAVVNCPIASIILAVEVFGSNGILLYAAAIFTSFIVSGYSGLYGEQKFVFSKQHFELLNRKTN